jgi:PFU (PLAA family ubiquitin binding)
LPSLELTLDWAFEQWDSLGSKWQKIGEVVDAVGSGRKQLFDGKEYDYVFDVDIQDGVPPLKLPYNANGMYRPQTFSSLVTHVYREPIYCCSTFSREE